MVILLTIFPYEFAEFLRNVRKTNDENKKQKLGLLKIYSTLFLQYRGRGKKEIIKPKPNSMLDITTRQYSNSF